MAGTLSARTIECDAVGIEPPLVTAVPNAIAGGLDADRAATRRPLVGVTDRHGGREGSV